MHINKSTFKQQEHSCRCEERTSLFLGLVLWIFDPRRLFCLFSCANLPFPLKAVCPQPRMVTGFLVSFPYPTLTTCVLHNVAERGKLIVALAAVHAVRNGHQPHVMLREELLRVVAHFQIIAAQAGQFFHEHGGDVARLNCLKHLMERQTTLGSTPSARARSALLIPSM